MKAVLSIFTSILIFFSSLSFTLYIDKCPMQGSANFSLTKTHSCCCKKADGSNCCKTTTIKVEKSENDYIPVNTISCGSKVELALFVLPVILNFDLVSTNDQIQNTFFPDHSPPDCNGPALFISHRQFLI